MRTNWIRTFLKTSTLCLLFINGALNAQSELAIGQWKSHLPYPSGNYVTQSDTRVYFATEFSLLSIDKQTFEPNRFSKVEGLSDVGISVIRYNQEANALIVVYQSSVIDVIREDRIDALFDIKNFQGILGAKEIYDIYVEDAQSVYLAANYGVSQLNIDTNEFPFTTFTGQTVNSVVVYQNEVYITTNEGIFKSPKSNAFIEDFVTWEKLDTEEGFPDDYTAGAIAVYNNKIYVDIDKQLFSYDGNELSFLYEKEDHYIRYITAEGTQLMVGMFCELDNCDGEVALFDENEDLSFPPNFCINRPFYGIEDEKGRFWFADKFRNFRVTQASDPEANCLQLPYNSPYSHFVEEIKITEDGSVYVASGGVRSNFSYQSRLDGVFFLKDNKWGRYAPFENPELNALRDFFDVEYDESTGTVYMAAYLGGLVIKPEDSEEFTILDQFNSSLGSPPGDPNNTRASGLAFDDDGNLWIANYASEDPISVLRPDGTTRNFRPDNLDTKIHEVVIDNNGYKWFASFDDVQGIVVFDEGDIDDDSDDRSRLINSVNSELVSNKVNCLAVDLDGDVWVGTEQGTVVFECGTSVFEDACIGSLRIVEVDSILANLLETENVKSIAVDGANRKWFGTDNGIFVQSPNGEEQIAYINVDNSPLFSNIINDIEINNLTGEVFIGTDNGLQSFKTDATEGGIVNSADIMVYPNPVRPDYRGPIAIKGLARDANVKITDITGQLVYETTALGGQAIWDGNDYNGRRASTGVYLVFSTSTKRLDNPDAAVAKILFIN